MTLWRTKYLVTSVLIWCWIIQKPPQKVEQPWQELKSFEINHGYRKRSIIFERYNQSVFITCAQWKGSGPKCTSTTGKRLNYLNVRQILRCVKFWKTSRGQRDIQGHWQSWPFNIVSLKTVTFRGNVLSGHVMRQWGNVIGNGKPVMKITSRVLQTTL